MLDIEKREQGLEVTHVKQLYGERACSCGHVTQTMPLSCGAEAGWDVALTEWHLVGPLLTALIVCLSVRMRLSRKRIQEFLEDWLGISLSTGCINQCITEGGRAAAPLEDEIIIVTIPMIKPNNLLANSSMIGMPFGRCSPIQNYR